MEMEIKCKKGEQVILTDNCDQSFLGTVRSVNHDLGRLVLSDIVQLPEHTAITGYRNFDKNEIIEIRKYEADQLRNCNLDVTALQGLGSDSILTEYEYNEIVKVQRKFRYIKDGGSNYHSAIDTLKDCKMIGLLSEDTSKGRCGRASIMAIATPTDIFVFDMLALGDDILHRGLKTILESPKIVKVVHDCRMLSDCFKHKHLIILEGVRDVEAEDIMLVHQERKMIRKHNRSLNYLIKVYLGVDVQGLDQFVNMWNERPLPDNQVHALVCLASFMLPLQEAIQQKYIERLIEASQVYNTFVRELDFFDFLHGEPKKTLRKQMIEVVLRQSQMRTTTSRNIKVDSY